MHSCIKIKGGTKYMQEDLQLSAKFVPVHNL